MTQLTRLTYPELARHVVSELAPGELELLDEVTPAWLAGELEGRGPATGEALGIGLDPTLTAALVYPVISGAVATVLSSSATGAWNRWMRTRAEKRARRHPPESVVPDLSPEQLELVRQICVERLVGAGWKKKRATAFADSVWGALDRRRRGADRPGESDENAEDDETAPGHS